MIDLHIHTNHSPDGQHSPEEIFRMAAQIGLTALAFADHDVADGLAAGERLAASCGIEFFPAIEINTALGQRDLHLLGYCMDWRSAEFQGWLAEIKSNKRRQAEALIERLRELGFTLELAEVERHARGGVPTGSCFLQAMLAEPANDCDERLDPYRPGGARSDSPFMNFFLDWLTTGRQAFVQSHSLSTVEAVTRLRRCHGVPVLAHPGNTPASVIDELGEAGLLGIEAYSTYHDAELNRHWLGLALNRHLLVTAGSDFHGRDFKPGIELGRVAGNDEALLGPLRRAAQSLAGG